MATLAAMKSEVVAITKRPDLDTMTESAVRAATLKAHQSDYFYKDLLETGIAFAASDYFQSLEYKTLIPRYRSLKYTRKYDNVNQEAGQFFDVVVPEQVLDGYGINREDILYVAGETIQFRSSTQFQYILFGCYIHPNITALGYNSWISDEHPWAIVYEAALRIFKSIAFDEEVSMYQKMVAEEYALLKASNITAIGY